MPLIKQFSATANFDLDIKFAVAENCLMSGILRLEVFDLDIHYFHKYVSSNKFRTIQVNNLCLRTVRTNTVSYFYKTTQIFRFCYISDPQREKVYLHICARSLVRIFPECVLDSQ